MILTSSTHAPALWDSNNAALLASFLETPTGKLTLQWLQYWAPALADGEHLNKTLVKSGEVKGYLAALENIVSLMVEQPVEANPAENYPSIDDASKWADSDETPTE
jgi:hypothetical protein